MPPEQFGGCIFLPLGLEPESSCAEDKCNELEEAWNSCVETAEILKDEVAEVPMGSISSRFITKADKNDFQKVFSLPKVYLQFLDVSRLNRGVYFHPNPGVSYDCLDAKDPDVFWVPRIRGFSEDEDVQVTEECSKVSSCGVAQPAKKSDMFNVSRFQCSHCSRNGRIGKTWTAHKTWSNKCWCLF